RVRSIAAIDPERTGSAPTFPARTRPDGPAPAVPPSHAAPSYRAFPPAAHDAGGQATHDAGPQEWAQATVLRRGAGSAPAAAEVASDAYAADTTIHRPAPVDEPAGDDRPGADHGKRNLWLAIAGGTLLALAAVVGLVVANAAPGPPKTVATHQAGKPPADALDNGTVPDVEGLAGAIAGDGNATFTWKNPQPKDGDTYKWRVYTIGGGGEFQAIAQPPVKVKANPSGQTCVQVMIVRSDGAFSPMEAASIACTGP
ncbi:MAG: serine/threonine protein kinase, partial [Pseudarthrobacter sp.]|nr:serine/threonine protein kinase [Pseudarthrobacter sp.]